MADKFVHTLPNGVVVVVTDDFFKPELCRADLTKLYIYGDNLKRTGMAGQACIRECSNAWGIATKVAPDRRDTSYFSDLYPAHRAALIADLRQLQAFLRDNPCEYTHVVFPAAGLGTGLSQLPKRAPKLYAELTKQLDIMFGVRFVPPLGSLAELI